MTVLYIFIDLITKLIFIDLPFRPSARQVELFSIKPVPWTYITIELEVAENSHLSYTQISLECGKINYCLRKKKKIVPVVFFLCCFGYIVN